jgi:hypothetical protein
MSGGDGKDTSVNITQPVNQDLLNYQAQMYPYLTQAQQAAPLSEYLAPQVKSIAGLSPLQQQAQTWIQGLMNTPQTSQQAATTYGGLASGTNANQQSALSQLAQLTGGSLGSSPTTTAGMNAFETLSKPSIQNDLAAMGMGRSGAGAQAVSNARTQALTPLLQQEIQNRANSVGQYIGLGNQQEQAAAGLTGLGAQQIGAAGQAAQLGGQAGGVEQQTAQAAFNAPIEDLLRRQGLSQSIFSLTPTSGGTTSSTTTPSKGFFGK